MAETLELCMNEIQYNKDFQQALQIIVTYITKIGCFESWNNLTRNLLHNTSNLEKIRTFSDKNPIFLKFKENNFLLKRLVQELIDWIINI